MAFEQHCIEAQHIRPHAALGLPAAPRLESLGRRLVGFPTACVFPSAWGTRQNKKENLGTVALPQCVVAAALP